MSKQPKQPKPLDIDPEHHDALEAFARTLKRQDEIIPIPKALKPDEIEGFKYPASEAFYFAHAVVGDDRGWQRRFARLIGAPAKHVVNLSWQIRNEREPNFTGAPAVRCAVLAKRLTDFATSPYMRNRLATRRARTRETAQHNDARH